MNVPVMLSARDVSLALSDPFGLWHKYHADSSLKDPISEYNQFLMEQGIRVEQELLQKRHASFTDLKARPIEEAAKVTAGLLAVEGSVIYGGAVLSKRLGLNGRPDVIKSGGTSCLVEEYKLARKPEEKHKVQVLVYGYILRNEHGIESVCQVVSGLGEEFIVPYDPAYIEELIQCAWDIVKAEQPPHAIYGCDSEWGALQKRRAKDVRDVSLAKNVGPVHAKKLHQVDIHTIDVLSETSPDVLKTIKGLGDTKVSQILRSAKAQATNQVVRIGPWTPLDDVPSLELFLDLEGTSELYQQDKMWNCIYLIGVIPRQQGTQSTYVSFMAKQPSEEKSILEAFANYLDGQAQGYYLYHWHHYEKTELKKAYERHEMSDRYEKLIVPFLRDLLVAAEASYVLPIPRVSIKEVAPYFGFQWAQDTKDVDAMNSAMIWFRQARGGGAGDGLEKILQYNKDDCAAMIVVKDGFDQLEREHRR